MGLKTSKEPTSEAGFRPDVTRSLSEVKSELGPT